MMMGKVECVGGSEHGNAWQVRGSSIREPTRGTLFAFACGFRVEGPSIYHFGAWLRNWDAPFHRN